MKPNLVLGTGKQDERGCLFYNNSFDASKIKRIYIIENHSIDFVRSWQGHRFEQRWFSSIQGSFKIELIEIDNWQKPNASLPRLKYILQSAALDILHVPAGYVSSIKALEEKSKLLVLANYHFGEIDDEFRYSIDYFKII